MEGSVRGIIPTHPVNIPRGRKPEYPEKTHDFRQRKPTTFVRTLTDSFHISVMRESVARIELTISEVKAACSDDCAPAPRDSVGVVIGEKMPRNSH